MTETPTRLRAEAAYTHPGSELTDDEVEFGRAMYEYQQRHRIRYPAWSDVLFVLRSLGYRKLAQAESDEPRAVSETS